MSDFPDQPAAPLVLGRIEFGPRPLAPEVSYWRSPPSIPMSPLDAREAAYTSGRIVYRVVRHGKKPHLKLINEVSRP